MTGSLAQLSARLEGDDWLQTLEADAMLLAALDAFFAEACAVQSKRHDAGDSDALQQDARVVYALYMRLLSVLQASPIKNELIETMRGSLLHLARLLPFCQLFGAKSEANVRVLLDTIGDAGGFDADLVKLRRMTTALFERIHNAVGLNRRPQVVELIQSTYEVALLVHSLAQATKTTELMFGHTDIEVLDSDSLLRALSVCYEADLPQLQRNLSKLDDKAQKRAALLVPESRRLLLSVFAAVLEQMMHHDRTSSGSGEGVLTILHELSHSTEAEASDHGSFVSDLWHVFGFEAKVIEFFNDVNMDRDNVSYLEVVLEGLPRRRVLEDAPSAERSANPPTKSDGFEPELSSSVVASSLSSLVSQVQDLFPDLGDGYVALCLLASQNQVETVINYLLESNPPPSVAGVRTDLKRGDAEYSVFEQRALGKEEPVPIVAQKSEKVDPSRIWKGKRTQEKHYDPQVARKDPSIVEKVKEIVDEYAEEDNFREAARNATANEIIDAVGGIVLDEYDDDYNDEFEDYEPFSVHDGGQADDFDAIRLQNRRLRALEAEDAFWDSIRNQNRRPMEEPNDDEGEDEGEDGDEGDQAGALSQWARGPARGEWKPQGKPDGAGATGPMSEQQTQRQRNRNTKNKAKVANHHRKDRALKKRG